MKKSYLIIIILVLVSLIVSCQVESTFRSKDINNLLKDISSEYKQVEKTKVKKIQGGINIYVYFTSTQDISIDEDIYDEFETFFSDPDVAERVADKFGKSTSIYPNYPSVTVYFVDSQKIESHDINTMGYDNEYDEWSEPYYFNKGHFVTDKRSSESVQEERRKIYTDIFSTIKGNNHTYVSVIYNFASLKDEHVVLRVTFNTENQFYEATESIWINEYDQEFNLVVDKIDWKSIIKSQRVKYFKKHSSSKKYVFGIESESGGIISSHYLILDKAKCENDIELKDNKLYRLLFTINEPNEIVSYIIKEIDDN
jgi:acid phosphatase family membrane protein YuiD